MAEWARAGVQMRVAINLSVHQLRELDLVERIATALREHDVKPSQLLCEITESVAMQDISVTQRTLDELGNIGVYLAIDDFGTGYSSLSYLRQLPARQLKIDRTFIKDLDTSDDAKAVVDGVVRLAHALGLRVVAEGVETARQRDILLELNCDELQGYFYRAADVGRQAARVDARPQAEGLGRLRAVADAQPGRRVTGRGAPKAPACFRSRRGRRTSSRDTPRCRGPIPRGRGPTA